MSFEDITLVKKPVAEGRLLYDSTDVRFLERSDSQQEGNGGAAAGEKQNWGLLFSEDGVSVWEGQFLEALEMNGADGHATV